MLSDGVRRLLDGLRLRRLEQRGDVVLDAENFWTGITYLAEDLMAGEAYEIPRDLFAMLAYGWAARAEKGVVHDPFDVLRHVRARAWLGYTNTPQLVEAIRGDLPRAEGAKRAALYLGEIAAKDSRYLFLPIVSRIDRHQGGSPLPARLELDAIDTEFGHTSLGSVARQAFALAPTKGRERDAFMLALMTAGWGRGTRVRIGPELIAVAADQLRLLYEQPIRALAGVRRDAPAHPAAARLVAMAEEVTTRDRPLWLETLFITENWRVGPQWFEHAFEVEAGTARDILLKRS